MTQVADYHTVFTVLQKRMPLQPFAILGVIFVVVTIAAVITIVRRKAGLVLVLVVYAAFLVVAVSLFPSGLRDMYRNAKDAYIHGRYSVIEGTVANFHPMPYSGHEEERFSVSGVDFSYSDYILVPCFNNTASHGGPIREGLRVRIAYSGNCILKLEVASEP